MRTFAVLLILSSVLFAQEAQYNYTTDSLAVRTILDSCGTTWWDSNGRAFTVPVNRVSDTLNGRIAFLIVGPALQGNDNPPKTPILHKAIGRLTALMELNIGSAGLKELPDELFNLPNLQILKMPGNYQSTITSAFSKLTNLSFLRLAGMRPLLDTLPLIVTELHNLGSLWLDGNALKTLPPQIGNLTHLDDLELLSNNIHKLPPEIGNLNKLHDLTLSSNHLDSLPSTIGRLQNLYSLHLDNNNLHTLPDSIVLLKSEVNVFSNNYLCSLPCAIQEWLDSNGWASGTPDGWRNKQNCPIIPVPLCSAAAIRFSSIEKRNSGRFSPDGIFDVRGREILHNEIVGRSNLHKMPVGIYLVKYRGISKQEIWRRYIKD